MLPRLRQSILDAEASLGSRQLDLRRVFNTLLLKAGGESEMQLCLTCSPTTSYYSKVQKKAEWVSQEHAGPTQLPTSASPDGASLRLRFRVPEELARENTQIVWWGATPKSLANAHGPASDPAIAYGEAEEWPNSGCVRIENDFVEICCQAPQSYYEEGKRWPRHIHLMGVKGNAVNPTPTMTVGVWPSADGELKDYTCEHLEGATHAKCIIVDFEQVKNHTNNDLWTVDATGQGHNIFASKNFRSVKFSNDAEMRKLGTEIGQSPVVVFCANPKCNAARKLIHAWQRLNLCPNYFYMHEGYEKHLQ